MRYRGAALIAAIVTMSTMAGVPAATPRAMPQADDNLTLAVGESVEPRGTALTIVFEKVEADSRCPRGVTCVWAGDAVVRLAIARTDTERTVMRLHTSPDAEREAAWSGYLVRLVELTPYPTSDRPIAEGEYRARLSITRAR